MTLFQKTAQATARAIKDKCCDYFLDRPGLEEKIESIVAEHYAPIETVFDKAVELLELSIIMSDHKASAESKDEAIEKSRKIVAELANLAAINKGERSSHVQRTD